MKIRSGFTKHAYINSKSSFVLRLWKKVQVKIACFFILFLLLTGFRANAKRLTRRKRQTLVLHDNEATARSPFHRL